MFIINCSLPEAMDFHLEKARFDLKIGFADYEFKNTDDEVIMPHAYEFYFNDTKDEKFGPNDEHMRRLQSIFNDSEIDDVSRVILHCFAGVSRSSAATLMLMLHFQVFKNPEDYIKKLFEINPYADPNEWMLKWIVKEYNQEDILKIVDE
jgi:predicted protein tyrosine phosphatase